VLFGWLPRWVQAIWGLFVAAFVIGEFGPLWNAPQWLLDISPFVHSPRLPAADASLGGLMPLVLVSLLGLAVGLIGWRRRDLHP
jgi:ABC-2 type transport system permease protein